MSSGELPEDEPAALLAEAPSEMFVSQEPPDRGGEGSGIVDRDEQSSFLVLYGLRDASDIGRDDGPTCELCFQDGEREPFKARRKSEDIECVEIAARIVAPAHPLDALRDTEAAGQLF